jgi:hypothetical protein
MKKLIPILLLLLATGSARAAAPVIAGGGAQQASGFGTSVSTLSVSLPSNVTAGNMILAFLGTGSTGIGINTPTMTGETFSNIAGCTHDGGATAGQIACYAVNSAAGGQKQVTWTVTGGTPDMHVHILEISGQSGSPQDATGNTTSTTLSVSTSGATTTANDLVIGFFYDNPNNRTFSAGSGYAALQQTNNSTGGDSAFSEDKTVSSTGVQTATASGNSGDSCTQGIIAVAGTGGGAAPIGANKRAKLEKFE